MTSQSDLPIWTFGDIWDGETEFAQHVPGHGPSYNVLNLDPDGSRRVLAHLELPNVTIALTAAVRAEWEVVGIASERIQPGSHYYAYDGTSSEEPVNQIPYLRAFLNHCCTFAHEALVDHQPHASRLRGVDSWNIAPDIVLDVPSINKNRVGMRYYRGRLGYFYDKIQDFEALPGDTSRLGQFDQNWRDELPEMQALDRDLCDDCRDDGGGSRLRDFIHHCNVAEWDNVLDAVETLSVGVSVQYRFRLPKINRTDPDNVRPHATRNVRTWVSNNASAESGWRIMMRDFDAAVKRYDRDPSVRMASPHTP